MYENFLNSFKWTLVLSGVMIFIVVHCPAQDRIDSLRNLLPLEDTHQQFEILYQLAYEYIDVNNEEALAFGEKALEQGKKNRDSLEIVKAGRIKSAALRRLERIDEALAVSRNVLSVAKRNGFRTEIKFLLNSLAILHLFKAEYDKSLEYNFQSLIIREEDGNKSEISIVLNNIGFVYFKLKNYDQALHYFTKTLSLKKDVGDITDIDRVMINAGLCLVHLKKFNEAKEYINNGLSTCKINCNEQIVIEGEFGLGVSDFYLGSLDDAEKHFQRSFDLSVGTGNLRFQAECLVYLAAIHIKKHNYDLAERNLRQAEELASVSGYKQLLMDSYKQYAQLYDQTKNYEIASKYKDKYIQLKDSLLSEELIKNLTKVQTDFAERENIATIAAKEAIIKQQRNLNFAIAVIAFLTALLMLVIQRSSRITKRVNAKLSIANETIEAQNKLLAVQNKELDLEVAQKTADLERVNASLKQVNDELDNFIYKTSHDIRGPLASLKGMCNVALMDVKDQVALDYLRKLDITAERLNSILTRLLIVNQINNSKLLVSKINFRSIVNEVIKLEKKKGLPRGMQIIKKIDPDAYIHSDQELVRIVLENLIDNSIKFYNDSNRVVPFVEIHILKDEGGGVKTRIIDNGIGISEANPGKLFQMFFRASERSEIGGIGLYIVKTSTTKLGGKVGLRTTPEGYTEFFVDFPQFPPKQEEKKKEDKRGGTEEMKEDKTEQPVDN